MPILTPTEYELRHVAGQLYDPVKAHEYYEKHKHLKGRQKGAGQQPPGFAAANAKKHEGAKAKQKRELAARIQALSGKLQKLEALIKKKEHDAASEDRKAKAKKERAAKDKNKPKTAAEKAKAERDAKKYRKEHKQELKNKAKQASSKSGGGKSSEKKTSAKASSVTELKALAVKVRGQIAVAKQKLAAL